MQLKLKINDGVRKCFREEDSMRVTSSRKDVCQKATLVRLDIFKAPILIMTRFRPCIDLHDGKVGELGGVALDTKRHCTGSLR